MFTAVAMVIVPVVFVWRVWVLCARFKRQAAKSDLKYQLENKKVA